MRSEARRSAVGALLGALLALAVACSGERPPVPPPPEPTPTLGARLFEQAQDQRTTSPKDAADLYRRVVREAPEDPAAPLALWELAHLQVDPQSPVFDYTAARRSFAKLCTTYKDRAAPERVRAAESWRAVLRRLAEAQSRSGKLVGEVDRLRGDVESERDRRKGAEGKLDRLKELEMEEDQQP